jgi:hypothetical protein
MNSLSLKFGCGYSGTATGTTASPSLQAFLSGVARVTATSTGKMCYVGTTTLTVSGTTTLDLTSGLTSPLNESINGALDFAKIYGVFIEHALTSLATSGITAFGGASNDQQGPWAAGDKVTLMPGAWNAFGWAMTGAGWTVDGTHKNIALVNLDGTALHTATVNVFILGTV